LEKGAVSELAAQTSWAISSQETKMTDNPQHQEQERMESKSTFFGAA
jgi:hypothetical protein